VEIGGIEVVNYRADKKIDHLSSPSSDIRKRAQRRVAQSRRRRIEKIRKGNLTVIVKTIAVMKNEMEWPSGPAWRPAAAELTAYGCHLM
jgi:hypothetical protein